MTVNEIFSILVNEIHTTVVAANDPNGDPVTSVIDMMLTEDEKLYFLTARGKSFYERLMRNQYVALSGSKGTDTLSTVCISLRGKVRNIGQEKLKEIFAKNTYMAKIYPKEEMRKVIEVFELYEGEGEFFDLRQLPVNRESFSFGGEKVKEHGYEITEQCNGCQVCSVQCPQQCIDMKVQPFTIQQQHCIRCGNCIMVCPNGAIRKR